MLQSENKEFNHVLNFKKNKDNTIIFQDSKNQYKVLNRFRIDKIGLQ